MHERLTPVLASPRVYAASFRAWRSELIADFGGDGTVSTQQLALVELAVRTTARQRL